MSGSALSFIMPGRGRFLLSFRPYKGKGFEKVGVILHNKIVFSMEGNHFEWVSVKPILGRGGKWDLWVRHEPETGTGAADWEFWAVGL